jgi:hypothetical protein
MDGRNTGQSGGRFNETPKNARLAFLSLRPRGVTRRVLHLQRLTPSKMAGLLPPRETPHRSAFH